MRAHNELNFNDAQNEHDQKEKVDGGEGGGARITNERENLYSFGIM